MVDMTLCRGGDCPVKCYCHRYIVNPSEAQYYFTELPFTIKEGEVTCNMYRGETQSSVIRTLEEVCNGKV